MDIVVSALQMASNCAISNSKAPHSTISLSQLGYISDLIDVQESLESPLLL